jgi:UDP-GlcNAc:undecaprenyl-phosphate GlcNAc-1-phosphate transferase
LVGSYVLSLILTAVVKRWALRAGFLADLSEDRFGLRIVPLGGGIAIFVTMASIIIAAALTVRFVLVPGHLEALTKSANIDPSDFLGKVGQLVVMLLCAMALFVLGLWDDKEQLGPFLKLGVEFGVAMIAAVFAEVRVELFIENRIVASVLSAVWVVLLMNAFNFLDNMDGLAAGIAIITGGIMFVAAAISGQVFVAGLAIVFVGTLLGFLVFNFPPAKIFMGDAGSLVVGFFAAVLTLRTRHKAGSGIRFCCRPL